MIYVFQYVVITTLKWLRFSITATPYVLTSLPCMTLSSFTLRLFIWWFRHKYRNFSRTTVWIWLFCFKYLLSFILLVFLFLRSDSISRIWYLFQICFTKKKPLYTDPQLLRQCKCCNFYHGRKITQLTILCVIALCVCLSIFYNQDVLFLDFVILFVVIIVAVIVVRNHLLGMDW